MVLSIVTAFAGLKILDNLVKIRQVLEIKNVTNFKTHDFIENEAA